MLIVADNGQMLNLIGSIVTDLAETIQECEDGETAVTFCDRQCSDGC
jgi:hypothetical protein